MILRADRTADRRHRLILPLAALVAVLPLIVHGCSCGHDFVFHLVSWMEAASQFAQGTLHPHWAYSPAYNAGEPRFVFYPPLSWYLGAFLGVVVTHLPSLNPTTAWNSVPILFTWIALTLSGLILYRTARTFAGANAALLAATIYLANPYMLFTAYERTAYAELLAAAWIPLLLHAILKERVSIRGIALPVALLWLTNAPAAVMGCYTLVLLAAVRIVSALRSGSRGKGLRIASNTAGGTALGFGLAAVYVIPAAYERRFVQVSMATIVNMRIDHNFLFEHTGTSMDAVVHDEVLRTASIVAVILLVATAIALVALRLQLKTPAEEPATPQRLPVGSLALLTVAIAFLLTSISAGVWRHAPEGTFLQFPWRLLAILAPVFALAVAAALNRFTLNRSATSLMALGIAPLLAFPAYHAFHQACDPQYTPSWQIEIFRSHAGTEPTDEYTPVTADNDSLKPFSPTYWLADSADAPAPALATPGAAPMHLTVTAPHAENLILNLRDYPAWHITRNGAPVPEREQRDDGLIAFAIPAGPSTIDIHYAHTIDRTIATATSALALLIFVSPAIIRRRIPL